MDIEIVFESIILGVMIILAVIGSSGVCWVTYDTFKSEPITGKSSLPKLEIYSAVVEYIARQFSKEQTLNGKIDTHNFIELLKNNI